MTLLELELVTTCDYGSCPTIYKITGDDGHLVVQGYLADDPTVSGERSVRIPTTLLRSYTATS